MEIKNTKVLQILLQLLPQSLKHQTHSAADNSYATTSPTYINDDDEEKRILVDNHLDEVKEGVEETFS